MPEPVRDEGWSVRVTEDRARNAESGGRTRGGREPVLIHADLDYPRDGADLAEQILRRHNS